ncbi:sulfatase-like hydrolase/transferase [Pelagicoccus mobilis]|uniref:Sulfatase-like hydrolase/transferase n=1 Tax=Pelagicoccus mobilis TaxID=415221 RepID=A0A934RVK1_9BACT|nr:sulfatase-like hydrolase/transferase [Pelagicoccus mobilis]MBK1877271.1 sulfatase-like hydrolase/transferase [Pelagicoccus mobilis]
MKVPLFVVFVSLVALVSAASKPNVILIMADDVGWEAFGCYGADDYETPNIDRLAESGIRFEHCYSTPICTPSRVQIMTGQYSFRNYTHFGYLNPQDRTFAHMMQDAGYKTAIAGKWQLNGLYNNLEGYDDNSRPHQAGFDEYCLWQLTKGKGEGERFWSPPIERNGEFITAEQNEGLYGPDLFTDFVCDFMAENQDEPFFVYYPMVLVHDPFVKTPDTIGDSPRTQKANAKVKDDAEAKVNFQAMVNYMDKLVGRIVAKTEALGVAENTIILFTADNGTHSRLSSSWKGQQVQGGKGMMKETGTHVPLVAYWKGHTPQGLVSKDLVDFTDMYPTFADAARYTMSERDPIDGRSFFPQLKGEKGNPRDWVFCHYEPYWYKKKTGQFARTAEYKLYADGGFFRPGEDWEEKNDLSQVAVEGERREVFVRLRKLLEECPPAPEGFGERDAEHRPTYQDWKNLHDATD